MSAYKLSRTMLLTGSPLIPGNPWEPCTHKNSSIIWELSCFDKTARWCLYSPGLLHFLGNLADLANQDFHQYQESPKQKIMLVGWLIQSKVEYCLAWIQFFFYYESRFTHSLPFFSLHSPWGVKWAGWSWWTGGSFRPSGTLSARQTITTLCHKHTYAVHESQIWIENGYALNQLVHNSKYKTVNEA